MGGQEEKVIREAMQQVEGRRRWKHGVAALRWLVAFWTLALAVFFLVPWPLPGKVWAAAHGICAQHAGHMLGFAGQLLPLCARDSGLYLGTLLGMAYLLARGRSLAAGRPARWFWIAFVAIVFFFAVDVANSTVADWFQSGVYPPDNLLRLSSGILLGATMAVPLLWALNLSFAGRQLDRPLLPLWIDLPALLLVAVLGGVALASGWSPLYVPLAVLSLAGMVGMLVGANFLWFLMMVKGRKTLDSGWEAIPFLLAASLAAVAEIAALSALRYRLGL